MITWFILCMPSSVLYLLSFTRNLVHCRRIACVIYGKQDNSSDYITINNMQTTLAD